MDGLLSEFQPDISVLVTPTSNGLFEVFLKGERVYSNQVTHRFPKTEEVVQAIREKR